MDQPRWMVEESVAEGRLNLPVDRSVVTPNRNPIEQADNSLRMLTATAPVCTSFLIYPV